MIKGLYFKLNQDDPDNEEIYDFFNNETKNRKISKITLLHLMMKLYKCYAGNVNMFRAELIKDEFKRGEKNDN